LLEIFEKLLRHPSAGPHSAQRSVSRQYILYATFAGVVFAVMQFGEVIARKSLGASELSVTLITMTMPVSSLTSIWWARLLVGRSQTKFLLFFGVIAYLALMSGIFLKTFEHLLTIHIAYFLINALIITSDNRILQQHIPPARTGRLFGLASGSRTAMVALVSLLAGWYMDVSAGGFRHVYFAAAIAGLFALSRIASIPTGYVAGADPQPINRKLFLGPLEKVFLLLKRRRDFLRFEAAFMLYGIAFMISLPVIPLYLVDDLHLSYSQIGIARGTVPQMVMILFIPLLGRLFDRTTPHRMAVIVFFLLSFFPLLLLYAGQVEGTMRMFMISIAFGFFGAVMSGVMVLWSLSSLRFAGSEDSGVYHSVHVAATGVRDDDCHEEMGCLQGGKSIPAGVGIPWQLCLNQNTGNRLSSPRFLLSSSPRFLLSSFPRFQLSSSPRTRGTRTKV